MVLARLLLGIFCFLTGAAHAEPVVHARLDHAVAHYQVERDFTYVMTDSSDWTLLTQRGLAGSDRATHSFYPDKQRLELIEAWVDQPDGTRITVPPTSIFTRPSASAQNAPGFTNSQTTTALFPQLREGSRTHIKWKLTQFKPTMFGFNAYNLGNFAFDTVLDETVIDLPADMQLTWRTRGFVVEDKTTNGMRHIVAAVRDTKAQEIEPAMVSALDFQPMFQATTLPNFAAIGAIAAREAAGRAAVTPEIQVLADRLAGKLDGLDAARAIYNWVTANIRYVAVYLNTEDGWVPHAAAEVLKAGYGDCKDYSVLMQALLAARGIKADMVVVNWSTQFGEPMLWTPYFNHAIVYLPDYDIFLNPTSRYAAFGALDATLRGKFVVRLTPEGQTLRTPSSTPDNMRYRMHTTLRLDRDGTVTGQAGFEMSPSVETIIRNELASTSSNAKLAETLLARTQEGGSGDLTASNPRDLATKVSLSADWSSPRAVNPQGGDTMLRVPAGPDLVSPAVVRAKLSPTGQRRLPLLAEARDYGWNSVINIPAGMKVARLPDDIEIANPTGFYRARYRANGAQITVERHLVVRHDVVAASDYKAMEAVLYAALVDARAMLVLSPVGE